MTVEGKSYSNRVKRLSRREALLSMTAGVGALAVAATPNTAAGTTTTFDITQAPFNADQSGGQDCTAPIQAALDAIAALGAGKLLVPAGTYKLLGPLTCNNASLTIIGDGQASSILWVQHTGTAMTLNSSVPWSSITIRDIGFAPSPPGGGPGGTALAISFPPIASGWQRCSISDVDLGVAHPNYTTFTNGIVFSNLWRGNIRNVNMHSNIGSIKGTSFFTLNGECIDNRFNNCSVDGIGTGFYVGGYSEGLHIDGCVIIGNNGISTGSAPYSGNGSTTPLISLLGLYVSNSEVNCGGNALHLMYTDTAWISNSHFSAGTAGSASALVFGCSKVQFSNCSFSGQFDPTNPQWDVGVLIGAAGAWPSSTITVDSCVFSNILIGVQFAPGTFNSSARDIRLLAPGEGSLVSTSLTFGSQTMRPCNDLSGNSTNSGQWVTSTPNTAVRDTHDQYLLQ